MSKLPVLKQRKIIAALKRAGFEKVDQHGSQLYLRNPKTKRTTTVPVHSKEISRPFLKVILKEADISPEEFRKLL